MIALLVVLLTVVCLVMVLLVLVQNSKGGGLASNIGAVGQVQQVLGTRKSTDLVQRLTWISLGVLVALAFAINIVFAVRSSGPQEGSDAGLLLGGEYSAPVNANPTTLPTEGIPGSETEEESAAENE